jgi:hypothetical protein
MGGNMHIALLILISSAFAGDMMNGGCQNYKTDVSQELKIWNGKAAPVVAGATVPLQTKVQYLLTEQKTVKFKVTPQKLMNKDGSGFAGTFEFKAEKTGPYQLALGKRAWMELIDAETTKFVEAGSHDMQTKCDKLVKVLSYNLIAGKTYWIQINSSPTAQLEGTIVAK